MIKKIEEILNRLPEVTWDRFTGDCEDTEFGVAVYGWIPREDGRSDFVLVRIAEEGCWMFATSSAKFSVEFGKRLGFKSDETHEHCKRVEDVFKNVKVIKL